MSNDGGGGGGGGEVGDGETERAHRREAGQRRVQHGVRPEADALALRPGRGERRNGAGDGLAALAEHEGAVDHAGDGVDDVRARPFLDDDGRVAHLQQPHRLARRVTEQPRIPPQRAVGPGGDHVVGPHDELAGRQRRRLARGDGEQAGGDGLDR